MKKTYYITFLLSFIFLFFPINVFGLDKDSSSDIKLPQNGIPVVIIRVDESKEAIKTAKDNDKDHEYGNIQEMNGSSNHSVRCVGTIEIVVPEGYESEYDLSDNPVGQKELSYIRGRGNST